MSTLTIRFRYKNLAEHFAATIDRPRVMHRLAAKRAQLLIEARCRRFPGRRIKHIRKGIPQRPSVTERKAWPRKIKMHTLRERVGGRWVQIDSVVELFDA